MYLIGYLKKDGGKRKGNPASQGHGKQRGGGFVGEELALEDAIVGRHGAALGLGGVRPGPLSHVQHRVGQGRKAAHRKEVARRRAWGRQPHGRERRRPTRQALQYTGDCG